MNSFLLDAKYDLDQKRDWEPWSGVYHRHTNTTCVKDEYCMPWDEFTPEILNPLPCYRLNKIWEYDLVGVVGDKENKAS